MSRTTSKLGDFDVITGPPAPLRRVPAVAVPRPPESTADLGRRPEAPPAARRLENSERAG